MYEATPPWHVGTTLLYGSDGRVPVAGCEGIDQSVYNEPVLAFVILSLLPDLLPCMTLYSWDTEALLLAAFQRHYRLVYAVRDGPSTAA